jgi:hypothetical protein
MFIDTIMALWNRIWYGKLKRVFVTSFLFGIGLLLLLIMIGVPVFSHSAPMVKRTIQSVDVADQREYSFVTQPPVDGLSTPSPVPATPVMPTLTAVPALSSSASGQHRQAEPAINTAAPTVTMSVPRHVRIAATSRSVEKHQTSQIVKKDIGPTFTSIPPATPTDVSTPPVVSTPTPELLPAPIIIITATPVGGNTLAPEDSPAPAFTGTVQPYPTLLPEITPTPGSVDLSWMNF